MTKNEFLRSKVTSEVIDVYERVMFFVKLDISVVDRDRLSLTVSKLLKMKNFPLKSPSNWFRHVKDIFFYFEKNKK